MHPSESQNNIDRVQALSAAPIFIVGSPRSGTTWVQRILLCHPLLCGGQETHFFSAAGVFLRGFHRVEFSQRVVGMPAYWQKHELESALLLMWQKTVKPLIERSPQAKVLIEKTPDHAMYMNEILEMLPQARFIHVIRDSRAVVSSLLAASASWAASWAPKNARDATILWHHHVTRARKVANVLKPQQYMELFYEDLWANPARQSNRLFEFIGLHVPPQHLEQMVQSQRFENQKSIGGSVIPAVAAIGAQNEPQGFFRSGKPDSWRSDLSPFQKLTVWRYSRKLMRQLGYSWRGRISR